MTPVEGQRQTRPPARRIRGRSQNSIAVTVSTGSTWEYGLLRRCAGRTGGMWSSSRVLDAAVAHGRYRGQHCGFRVGQQITPQRIHMTLAECRAGLTERPIDWCSRIHSTHITRIAFDILSRHLCRSRSRKATTDNAFEEFEEGGVIAQRRAGGSSAGCADCRMWLVEPRAAAKAETRWGAPSCSGATSLAIPCGRVGEVKPRREEGVQRLQNMGRRWICKWMPGPSRPSAVPKSQSSRRASS